MQSHDQGKQIVDDQAAVAIVVGSKVMVTYVIAGAASRDTNAFVVDSALVADGGTTQYSTVQCRQEAAGKFWHARGSQWL